MDEADTAPPEEVEHFRISGCLDGVCFDGEAFAPFPNTTALQAAYAVSERVVGEWLSKIGAA